MIEPNMARKKEAERLVFTVHPSGPDDGLLRVDDAFLQVLDFLRVTEDAMSSLPSGADFVWRLESASTNSPFTVVAVADPIRRGANVREAVRSVKRLTRTAVRDLASGSPAPGWMSAEGAHAMQAFFRRNTNGVDHTNIDFKDEGAVEVITPQSAALALPSLEPMTPNAEPETPARTAFGEIDGRMVAVGRHYNRPALQMHTTLYGTVWCVVPDSLVEQLGGEQTMADVWRGKKISVYGQLTYAKGGRLARIEAHTLRERETPAVRIEDLLDPDFTSGLDPAEYLERLHGGDLG